MTGESYSYTAKLAALVKTQSGDPMSAHEAEQLYSLALYMAGLLDRLLPEDRKFVVCNRHGFAGLEYCPECTSYGSPGPKSEPVAWMRAQLPHKRLKDVTINKCLADDIPLYRLDATHDEHKEER